MPHIETNESDPRLKQVQRFPEYNQAGTYEATYTLAGFNPKETNGDPKNRMAKTLKVTVILQLDY